MDLVRRNTDYAVRLMVNLARNYRKGPVSTRTAAAEEDVPYQLACKLMQKMHNSKLLESSMGPRGGFNLSRDPSKITLLELVETIQGPITVNRCLSGPDRCPRQESCPVTVKLARIQEYICDFLGGITLDQFVQGRRTKPKAQRL
jgi:Rrf2 family iron-sulfur cluster assembly transcriptional regulator